MIARSVYIIQTQLIGLGKMPLSLHGEVVTSFKPVFESPNCFAELRSIIFDRGETLWGAKGERKGFVPNAGYPFIQGLGGIEFNTRSLILVNEDDRRSLAHNLAKCGRIWDPKENPLDFMPDDVECFGYDPEQADQRMHHLYFELNKPIYLYATSEGRRMASGRIFVHFYPSGFLVLHLAVALGQSQLGDLKTMGKAIWETSPWRENPDWTWTTKFSSGRLHQVVSALKERLIRSMASDKPLGIPTRERRWYTTIRFDTSTSMEMLAKGIFKGDLKRIELERQNRYYFSDDVEPEGELMVAKHGLVCKPFQRNTDTRLEFVWKILSMAEHALIKDFVYESYAAFLAEEVMHLKDIRRRSFGKLTKDDILKLSVYRSSIPQYLFALDRHYQHAPQFYQFVGKMVLNAIGHPKRVEKVSELVGVWEEEVDKWENPLVSVWKQIIDPLRDLLIGRLFA